MRYNILYVLLLFFTSSVFGQKQWDLEECIDYATRNNLDLKTQSLNITAGNIKRDKAKLNYLPSLVFNTNSQYSAGRSLDPTTHSFVENTNSTVNASLNFSTTLFDGMKRYNNYRKSLADLGVAQSDYETMKDDIALSVTMAYLNVLLNRKIIASVRSQIDISDTNVNRAKRLLEEGAFTDEKLQNLLVQRNNELYSLADAEGALKSSVINLCSLLNLHDYDFFDVKEDTISIDNSPPISDVISAVGELPQMKSARYKIKSAEYDLRLARSDMFPDISLGAAMGSSFSDARQQHLIDESGVVYRSYPFINQMNDNRNSNISLSLSFPVFGFFQSNKNIALARHNIQFAQYEAEKTGNKLIDHIWSIYAEIETARKKYDVATSSVEKGKIALKYAGNKLENGTLTFADYSIEKENVMLAEAQALKANYEYRFKIILLKFYYNRYR
ncbi:MAG: TolC family protein [Dysgonamonadaceae bacterium]|jgi:outer membrane protein|nr:TolC family protein [Dysgonamonadaceae bacterium]